MNSIKNIFTPAFFFPPSNVLNVSKKRVKNRYGFANEYSSEEGSDYDV